MADATTHHLTVSSETRYLGEVRRFVARHAEGADLSEQAVQQLRMAVDEACANVIEHAYEGDASREIDVAVIVAPGRFTVRIRDEGRPFQQEQYNTPNVRELVKHRRSGGLGVQLMHRLMDRVEYRTREGTNEVHLTKYRNGRQAG